MVRPSIVAEGAGEFSRPEKARFYRMARRSAVEVVAWLDITRRRNEADRSTVDRAIDLYEAIAPCSSASSKPFAPEM